MANKYYVHFGDEGIYSGPYNRKNALTYARIGAQRRKDGSASEDRIVTRGVRGPVVRVYETDPNGKKGVRAWPQSLVDVNSLRGKNTLLPSEFPRTLVDEDGYEVLFKVVKRGSVHRAVEQ